MARARTITVSCFNIRNENERPFAYFDLLEYAYSLKQPIQVYGESRLMLTSFERINESQDAFGTISRFSEIDIDADWLNIDALKAAEENDLIKINIPDHLKPNLKSFFYFLDSKNHKLYVEHYGMYGFLSETQVIKFLKALFDMNAVFRKFGPTYATQVASLSNIDRIMKETIIRSLDIYIEPPNPDDLGELEERLKERLHRQNAKSLEETYRALPNQGIRPDEDTLSMVAVAAANGRVDIKGKNEADGTPVDFSSKQSPERVSAKYDPGKLTERQGFMGAVRRAMLKINNA